jgi:4-amino-4-deoxy-L-arabinose transferase-like glycosyltransferase
MGDRGLVKKIQTPMLLLIAAAVLSHVVVYLMVEQHPQSRILYDSREYLSAGSNLLSQGVLYSGKLDGAVDPALFTKRPPAYPLLVGLILQLGGGIGGIVLLQVILTLSEAILLYWIAGLLDLRGAYRLATATVFLFYPAQIIYSQVVMAEILVQFLLFLSFVFLITGIKKNSLSLLGLVNLTLGLAALTKPVMVYFWIPNLLYHVWLAYRLRSVKLVGWAFIPLLIVSGWSYRNYLVTGYFHFSSVKTINMKFNLDGSSNPQALPLTEHSRIEDFGSWSREVERDFIRDRISNWPATVYRQFLGNLAFLLDPGRFDIFQILGIPHSVRFPELLHSPLRSTFSILAQVPLGILVYLGTVLLLNLLVLASFLYVLFKEDVRLEYKVYWVMLVLYVIVLTGPIGASRFRLEVEPFLLLALPFFLKRVMSAWQAKFEP